MCWPTTDRAQPRPRRLSGRAGAGAAAGAIRYLTLAGNGDRARRGAAEASPPGRSRCPRDILRGRCSERWAQAAQQQGQLLEAKAAGGTHALSGKVTRSVGRAPPCSSPLWLSAIPGGTRSCGGARSALSTGAGARRSLRGLRASTSSAASTRTRDRRGAAARLRVGARAPEPARAVGFPREAFSASRGIENLRQRSSSIVAEPEPRGSGDLREPLGAAHQHTVGQGSPSRDGTEFSERRGMRSLR
jgi:hypothetical protein